MGFFRHASSCARRNEASVRSHSSHRFGGASTQVAANTGGESRSPRMGIAANTALSSFNSAVLKEIDAATFSGAKHGSETPRRQPRVCVECKGVEVCATHEALGESGYIKQGPNPYSGNVNKPGRALRPLPACCSHLIRRKAAECSSP